MLLAYLMLLSIKPGRRAVIVNFFDVVCVLTKLSWFLYVVGEMFVVGNVVLKATATSESSLIFLEYLGLLVFAST